MGRIMQRAKTLPQSEVIRQLNPKIRGWAHYYRICVSQAVYSRLDQLTWEKLRRWAHRRHNQIRRMGPETVLASV